MKTGIEDKTDAELHALLRLAGAMDRAIIRKSYAYFDWATWHAAARALHNLAMLEMTRRTLEFCLMERVKG